MEVLNLYAGVGGNRKLWDNVKVTAVEIDPKIANIYKGFYPSDRLILCDAHQYLLDNYDNFDFIWSSPPCQSHTKLIIANTKAKKRYPDMKLYEEILFLKAHFKGLWVVENVVPFYEPLIKAQKVSRHLFWANFYIPPKTIKYPGDFSRAPKEELMTWSGIYYKENVCYNGNHNPEQILRNAVHPTLGLHVFKSGLEQTKTLSDF